jgi:hypothetical protein
MKIIAEILKCVAFIGIRKPDDTMALFGTVFFIGLEGKDGKIFRTYCVTAKHVIDKIREKGDGTIYIRANLKQGTLQGASMSGTDWHFHPQKESVDVAILPMAIPEVWDHLCLSMNHCITKAKIQENEIGIGEEVFITGLFRHHTGKNKNIPIVRVGNIATMAEEKVNVNGFGLIDAYLAEVRSIGGLSGSPVFYNLGHSRIIKGAFVQSTAPIFYLMGLIHGHYDVTEEKIDELDVDAIKHENVNTGIAIVVPIGKVLEAINHCEVNFFKSAYKCEI